MTKHSGKLLAFCKDNNITIKKLSDITGVSEITLKMINKNEGHNISIKTIEKIYEKTNELNIPLTPDMYLNYRSIKRD